MVFVAYATTRPPLVARGRASPSGQPNSSVTISSNCRCSSRHSRMRRNERKCVWHQSRNFDCVSSSCASVYAAPEFQHADEIRFRIGKHGMRLIGRLASIRRAFARILDAEERREHEHLAQRVSLLRFDQHAPERTSIGNLASVRPIAVSVRRSVDRSRRFRPGADSRRAIARSDGASRNGNSSTSPSFSASMRRITPASDERRISGSV